MLGGQVSDADRLRSARGVRTRNSPPRPAPVPRPGVVDACAALAGLGFGAVLAAVILGESRGSLAAPGGLLSGGRAHRLRRDVPDADHGGARGATAVAGALGRSGSAGPLAPAGRPVGDRPHHGPCRPGRARLRAGGQTGAWHELWVLLTSYRDMLAAAAGFGLLIMAAVSSYRRVRRRDAGARRGGSSTCTCYSGLLARSPTRSSPASPSSATRWSGRCGSGSGRPPREWSSCSGSRSRSGGACGITSGWSRSAPRRPGWSRWSAGDGTSTGWRYPGASSSLGNFSPGTCW